MHIFREAGPLLRGSTEGYRDRNLSAFVCSFFVVKKDFSGTYSHRIGTRPVGHLPPLVRPRMNDVRIEGREVGRIGRAYLFSHYDSRGGSSLVVIPTLARALTSYADQRGLDEQTAADLAEEDYVARYAVIVCDRPISLADDGTELLSEYCNGGGYSFGVIQARWYDDARRHWSTWEDTAYAVLWTGALPTVAGQARPLPEELRIDVRDVGEDGWGLALFWPDGR